MATRITPGRPILSKIRTAINQDLKIVKPKIAIDVDFLYYAFRNLEKSIRKQSSGTTVLGVNLNNLKAIKTQLPSLPEQRAIVAKIDELFSELDNGIANLKAAQAKLDIYRQAVLKQAFEGELTREWRERQTDLPSAEKILNEYKARKYSAYQIAHQEWLKNKLNKPKELKCYSKIEDSQLNELISLPSGWVWCKLGEVTNCLDYLRKPINKEERATRLGNIPYYGANGQVGWIDDYIFDDELVVVVEDETFIGRRQPFSYKIKGKTWVNNHAHVLKNEEIINVDYLNYNLMFYPFTPLTTGTTGRKKLTQQALNNAPFALCSLEEQTQIVQEIEARLSVCDKLAETIQTSLQQAEALRQSILKKAFEGRLLTETELQTCKAQADWMPAEQLLAQIKSTKAKG